jgi:phosphoribosylanthranilate isomerase
VATEVKFCGLTRAADAAMAASLGASYAGVIFAAGPRHLTMVQAIEVVTPLRGMTIRRVGVFADQDPPSIEAMVTDVGLDVVQLHGANAADRAQAVRARLGSAAEVWVVVPMGAGGSPEGGLPADVHGMVFDTAAAGRVGGSGRAFDWAGARGTVDAVRGSAPIILAGGLHPGNVASAIALLAPDVVDVSSGVESAPGLKDHERMRAFVDAVRGAAER